jgi:hypothetical protein
VTDLSKVPDDVLLKLVQQRQAKSLESMSDEELMSAYRQRKATGQTVTAEPSPFSPEQEALISDRLTKLKAAGTGGVRAGAETAMRSGSFGLANIAEGLINRAEAAVRSGSYSDNLAALQEADKRYREGLREENPVASVAGDIGGGFTLGGALSGVPGLAQSVKGAAPMASTGGALAPVGAAVKSFMSPAQGGLVKQIGKGAAQGAAVSGVYAATEGDNVGEAAVAGGVVGGAVPLAIGLGKGLYSVADNVASPWLRPQEFAAKKWAQANERAPGGAQGSMARAQANEALPIDYATEEARVLARAAADVPNPGTGRTTAMMNTRQLQQGSRVEKQVSKAFGDADLFDDKIDDALAALKKNGETNFDAARAAKKPVNVTPVLAEIDKTIAPGVNRIVSPGSTIADDSVSATLARVRSMLASSKDQLADLEDLHLVKMDLDGMIEGAKRQGNNTLSSKLMGVKRSLLNAMEADNPLYGVARKQFAGDAAIVDALENGLTYFSGKGATLSARDLQQMSAAEVKAFKYGVSKSIQQLIDAGADGADAVKKVIGSQAKRDALDALFETPKARREFYTSMLVEARKYRSRAEIIGNSKTNRYMQATQEGGVAADAAKDLLTGGIGGALRSMATRTLSRAQGMTPEVANEYLKLATARNPQATAQMQALLRQAGGRKVVFDQLREALMRGNAPVTSATLAPVLE